MGLLDDARAESLMGLAYMGEESEAIARVQPKKSSARGADATLALSLGGAMLYTTLGDSITKPIKYLAGKAKDAVKYVSGKDTKHKKVRKCPKKGAPGYIPNNAGKAVPCTPGVMPSPVRARTVPLLRTESYEKLRAELGSYVTVQ